jgi:hypothetical protein
MELERVTVESFAIMPARPLLAHSRLPRPCLERPVAGDKKPSPSGMSRAVWIDDAIAEGRRLRLGLPEAELQNTASKHLVTTRKTQAGKKTLGLRTQQSCLQCVQMLA